MAINLNECRKSKAGNIITAKGRMLYPALFKPSAPKGEDESKAKYQITMLFPASADLKLLIDEVNQAITDKWGADAKKKYKIKMPFLKTEEQGRLSDHAEEYPVMIRAGSKDRPGLVYANGETCGDDAETYGGRWCVASLRPYAYDHPVGGKGVSFGLSNVQLLDHDERLGGGRVRAEDEFEPVAVEKGASGDDIFS